MKVLLIGEFSGFYTTLKNGLNELGYNTTHASYNTISWRSYGHDISLLPNIKNKRLKDLYRYCLPAKNIKKLLGYDIVQFINPAILSPINPFNAIMGRQIAENSGKIFLSACGDDAFYWRSLKSLRYNPLHDSKAIDYKGKKLSIEYPWYLKWNEELAKKSVGIIPVMYDYAQAYYGYPDVNLRKTIPLPVNLKKIPYIGCYLNKIKKIRVFHGLNREGFKGTKYIREAFLILEKKFSTCAEFIIDGHIPYESYINYLSTFDIIVDQANSYSCGLNGIIGLALGKVVVGGAEPESLKEFGVCSSPVVNITPNVNDIVEKISVLIENKIELESIGYKSRCFAEKHHDYIKISENYLKEWRL